MEETFLSLMTLSMYGPNFVTCDVLWLCLQIFQGNTNTHISEMREVDPLLIARRVRFVPYSSHSKIVCLRVELYGCVWTGKSAMRCPVWSQ